MIRRHGHSWVVPLLGLLLVAGSLRFYGLGEWSHAGDETATFEEVDSLFGRPPAAVPGQIARLPRLIPLAHSTLQLGYQIFGRSELGSRMLPALLGTLNVGLLFLLLRGPLGLLPAFAAAFFVALWPEHLFHSQENRFYIPAEFMASMCMAAGALAAYRRSLGWMIVACLFAFLAILFHTTLGLLQIGLVISFTVANFWDHRPRAWYLLGAILATTLASRILFTVYLMPVYGSWNAGSGWGYSPLRAGLSSVAQLGLPLVLLALVGCCLAISERSAQGCYWAIWVGLWAAVSLCLPLLMVYQPSYAFSFAPAVCVMAGLATARIYDRLRGVAPAAAIAWFGVVFLMSAPSLISYYFDGSRHDFRSAAGYVADHFQEGDRVAAMSAGVLSYYTPICHEAIPLTSWDPLPDLEAAAAKPGRLWIVVSSGRSGKPEALTRWLAEHARLEAQFRKKRLDYYDYVVEVYLRPASPTSGRNNSSQ